MSRQKRWILLFLGTPPPPPIPPRPGLSVGQWHGAAAPPSGKLVSGFDSSWSEDWTPWRPPSSVVHPNVCVCHSILLRLSRNIHLSKRKLKIKIGEKFHRAASQRPQGDTKAEFKKCPTKSMEPERRSEVSGCLGQESMRETGE